MRSLKLGKAKSNEGPPPKPIGTGDASAETDMPFRTSFDDLRRPENRQMLRQHLTGHFPESRDQSIPDEGSQPEHWLRPKPSRSFSSSAQLPTPIIVQEPSTPSSTASSASAALKRLSTVAETNTGIDIEQAITLLQELRKTASPEQLVALHKALLPTRDSMSSVASSQPLESSTHLAVPPVRQRSLEPPGFATRRASGEDPLKKQEDRRSSLNTSSTNRDAWGKVVSVSLKPTQGGLAALDLATVSKESLSDSPVDTEHFGMGGYKRGSLRITNGAATPDTSVHGDSPINEKNAGMSWFKSTRASPCALSVETSSNQNLSNDSQQALKGQHSVSSQQSKPTKSPPRVIKPVARSRDPSQSRTYRQLRPTPSAEQLRAEEAAVVAARAAATASNNSRSASRLSNQSGLVNRYSSQSITLDEDGQSMTGDPNLPRFAQRWSHRLQHISQECVIEAVSGEIGEDAPIGERLKLVSSGEISKPAEDAEAALRRLNGVSESNAKTLERRDLSSPDGPLNPVVALARAESPFITTSRAASPIDGQPAWPYHRLMRPTQPSPTPISDEHNDVVKPQQTDIKAEPRAVKTEQEEAVSEETPSVTGGRSLYTVEDILRKPYLLEELLDKTNTPPNAVAPHHSFAPATDKKVRPRLSLSTIMRSGPVTYVLPTESISALRAEDESPPESKKTRKLQKQASKKKAAEKKSAKERSTLLMESATPVKTNPSMKLPREPSNDAVDTLSPTTEHNQLVYETSFSQAPGLTALPHFAPAEGGRDEINGRLTLHLRQVSNFGRRRSKSIPRNSYEMQSKSGGIDLCQMSCVNNPDVCCDRCGERKANDGQSSTNQNSMARALNSSPFERSSAQFKRTVAVPGPVQHQGPAKQSQLIRSKSSVVLRADAMAPSGRVRPSSRDSGIKTHEVTFIRPRATVSASQTSRKEAVDGVFAPSANTSTIPAAGPDRLKTRSSGLHLFPLDSKTERTQTEHVQSDTVKLHSSFAGSKHTETAREHVSANSGNGVSTSVPSLPIVTPTKEVTAKQVVAGVVDANTPIADLIRTTVAKRKAGRTSSTKGRTTSEVDPNAPIADIVRNALAQRKAEETKQKVDTAQKKFEVKEARSVVFQRVQGAVASVTTIQRPSTSESIVIGLEPDAPAAHSASRHHRQHSMPVSSLEHGMAWSEGCELMVKSLRSQDLDAKSTEISHQATTGRRSTIAVSAESSALGMTAFGIPLNPARVHAETYAALIGQVASPDHQSDVEHASATASTSQHNSHRTSQAVKQTTVSTTGQKTPVRAASAAVRNNITANNRQVPQLRPTTYTAPTSQRLAQGRELSNQTQRQAKMQAHISTSTSCPRRAASGPSEANIFPYPSPASIFAYDEWPAYVDNDDSDSYAMSATLWPSRNNPAAGHNTREGGRSLSKAQFSGQRVQV